jgi:sterol desaturase/sphingolipid hydroxylase (fatty acid hydroxylase superfamily)
VAGAFASDPMEQSKAGYYADFILYPLLIMGLVAFETGSVHEFPYLWLCSLALGLLIWTIVEYGAHRFILHSTEAFSRLHERHHATPGAYVGTPTWISLLCFALGGFTPTLILFGWDVASGVTTGLTLGYVWYLVVHDAVHRRHLKHSSLLYRAKMHHALHHYARVRGNYGVSSPFWDYVFGSYIALAPRRSMTAVGEGRLTQRQTEGATHE